MAEAMVAIRESGVWLAWLRGRICDVVGEELKAALGRYSLSLLVGDLMESLGASQVIVPDASDGDRHGIPEPPTEFSCWREDADHRDAHAMDCRPYADVIATFHEMRTVACIWIFGPDESLGLEEVHDFLDCVSAMRDLSREDYLILPWIITMGAISDGEFVAAARHSIAVTDANGLSRMVQRFVLGG